jgi:cell wall-associated NlpC family hydrolase
MLGLVLASDADLQAAWTGAVAVHLKQLRTDDLLLFDSAPDHITHTGIYIGRGQFIYDTTRAHPGVQSAVLGTDQPWKRFLVVCRRIQ